MVLLIVAILLVILVGAFFYKFVPNARTSTFFTVLGIVFLTTVTVPHIYYSFFTDNTFIGKLVRMETPNEIGNRGPQVHMLYFIDGDNNKHVVQNDDSLLRWKWNSKDYRASEIGKYYQVTTQGYRVGVLSMQPNLLDMIVYDEPGVINVN